ncbi:uncharacterized protein (TIGR03086 family) [Stackebrandtia endophytica]|uniref:Uncharacterized protein (TIGR03086 family) n=1 Tax=Stackebrandtia endophytica TaxID=1496996 RepID=A0A543AX06_9ACTN|nr:TIGR03086 family metal-binding protein [Stackebrandtia endophytica]TQL77108.1 uncharacterized protein (TIGR03086 family) [Stackebrandtia endophytica]
MINLAPAADHMSRLLTEVRDDQLDGPTPCEEYHLGDLIQHVDGLAVAFRAAADKAPLPPGTPVGLDEGWRERIGEHLRQLVAAWRAPEAWEGRTEAGGVELTGAEAGAVALNELVIHGWDVARSIDRTYEPDETSLAVSEQFVTAAAADPVPGLFAPPVPVAEDASRLDRVVGLAGRDPHWRP